MVTAIIISVGLYYSTTLLNKYNKNECNKNIYRYNKYSKRKS
mgnify:CR=1 FL=1